MLWSAPVATTELSGHPSHVFAPRSAKYASGNGMKEMGSSTWRSQSIRNASSGIRNSVPNACSPRLMAPLVGSYMFRQTVATMIGGMTTGRMKIAR